MNLIEFHDKISSNTEQDCRLFSQEITIFNIINGLLPDINLVDISIQEDNKFVLTLTNEDIANRLKDRLEYRIIPGSYDPMYQVLVEQYENSLYINMIKIA